MATEVLLHMMPGKTSYSIIIIINSMVEENSWWNWEHLEGLCTSTSWERCWGEELGWSLVVQTKYVVENVQAFLRGRKKRSSHKKVAGNEPIA